MTKPRGVKAGHAKKSENYLLKSEWGIHELIIWIICLLYSCVDKELEIFHFLHQLRTFTNNGDKV
jgi:hypothetical protein